MSLLLCNVVSLIRACFPHIKSDKRECISVINLGGGAKGIIKNKKLVLGKTLILTVVIFALQRNIERTPSLQIIHNFHLQAHKIFLNCFSKSKVDFNAKVCERCTDRNVKCQIVIFRSRI